MKRCLRCNSSNSVIETEHTFHDIYKCLVCNYLTPTRIEDCCKSPYQIVSIDDNNRERRRLHRQCIKCGGCVDRTRPLSFKKYAVEIESEFSHYNYEKWKTEQNNETKMLWECVKERNYDTSKYAKYSNYIQSKDWKIKRNEALTRDNNLCQVCKKKPAEEVHHITYENLFCEKLEDLLSVCKLCHNEIHEKLNREELEAIRNKINDKKGIS